MNTEFALKEYGLTDKETKVYLTLLSIGNGNLQEIAKRVEFPRTTVYNTLNYLSQKGLAAKIIRKGVTYFEATEPKKFVDNLEEKKKLIQSVIPELESLRKSIEESSSVEIFEGFKGVYTVISDVFQKKQQTYYFGGYAGAIEILKHLPDHARMMRLEKEISAKIIIAPFDTEMFHEKKYQELTEMRFLEEMKDFPVMILIYGEKVAIHTVKGELIGIIIKNKQIAQAMLMIFQMYWERARKNKK